MSKYRSHDAPATGASVSETHHGYWADRIKKEERITDQWYRDYGHLYYEKDGGQRGGRVAPDSQPVSHLRSMLESAEDTGRAARVKESDERSGASTSSCYGLKRGQFVPSGVTSNIKGWDFPNPGIPLGHEVIKDPVTSYSESYGHSRYAISRPLNVVCAPCDRDAPASHLHCSVVMPHATDRRSPFPSSQDQVGCSVSGLSPGGQKKKSLAHPPHASERFSKSHGMLSAPVDGGPSGPSQEEMTSWPPQVQLRQAYDGLHRTTQGDLVRLRNELSTDQTYQTSMNRNYDQMKRVNFYGGKPVHAGPRSCSCVSCCIRTPNDERGSWLGKEQPFNH